MKARKLFAALGAGLILACCVTIYLMLDVTLFPQKVAFKDNQWLHFESRLAKLEEDFKRHHRNVNKQQKQIQKNVPDYENLQNADTRLDVSAEEPAVCTTNFQQLPEVDIQMLDVYKQLKFDNPNGGPWTQGWNITCETKQWEPSRKLKVFVVPHSHNDPGWLNTFEKYYVYQTERILNNTFKKLAEDKRRKFIWAEISFFKLWWDDQTQATREVVKSLVHNGQLEIVAGGYVMPDESVSHWMAQLTQLTEGHQWLKANLDYVPKTGWAIDPFGLSPTMPYLLKKAGLENLVIQRVHYSVKKKLAWEKHLEFRWRQLWDNEGTTELFTHMMPFYSYDIPHTCGPDPKICCQFDFFRLPSFGFSCPWRIPPKAITKSNIGERAAILLDQYCKKAQLYRTNVLLVPLGDDFRYSHLTEWDAQFSNYQKLFDYMNADRKMNVQIQFGTLTDYFEALRDHMDVSNSYPSLSGDFFTYSDRDDHYWSGYYTSRPFHKRLDRVLLGSIRGSELLATLAWIRGNDLLEERMANRLDVARRWHSLFQHHDGVTGTARDHVVIDYAQKMIVALNNSAHILQQSVMHLMRSPQKAAIDLEDTYLSMDKTRSHHTSPGNKYVISIGNDITSRKVLFYNSLPRTRTRVESVYVSTPYVHVTDKMGMEVVCQVSPVWVSPAAMSAARYELSFLVTVPAFGVTTYIVHSLHDTNLPPQVHLANVTVYNTAFPLSVPGFNTVQTYQSIQEFSISQGPEFSASFGKHGLLKAVRVDGTTYPVHLEFVKYGTRGPGQDRSGAYLFLPDKPEPDPIIDDSNKKVVHLVTGPILSRVFTDLPYVKHICTIYNSEGSDGLGLHITNEVDITETQNFELAMRINTDIRSGDVFYTDLNGLNMIKRQRFSKIPTQGNFYPLAAAGYIEDKRIRMTVVTGQPLGATSMSSGQFEIMQDRKLMQDDNRGLSQGVMDNLLTFHQFTLLLEKRQESCVLPETSPDHPAGLLSLAGHLALEDLLHPIVGMHPRPMAPLDLKPTFSPLASDFPVDLSVVSLRVIPIPSGAGKGVGVTLHRQALNLCWGNKTLQKRFPVSKTGEIDLSTLKLSKKEWIMSETPLTFTKVGRLRSSTVVNVCPHELVSLLFHKK